MQKVKCPYCSHVHHEPQSLVSWGWPCAKCGGQFFWNPRTGSTQDLDDTICYNGNHPSVNGVCMINGGVKQ
jgi:DNA-directed RNA polymerase subunit RPC12/RpoP